MQAAFTSCRPAQLLRGSFGSHSLWGFSWPSTPHTGCGPRPLQQVDQQGLSLASVGVYFLGGLSGLLALRWCILLIMSYASMAKRERELFCRVRQSLPYVSILAPAYCEAACVQDAMSALVRLDYPAYEVIFVDDGSTDNTYQLALSFAGTHCSEHGRCDVRVFTKPNQGKWSAHNYGLRHAKGKPDSLYRR